MATGAHVKDITAEDFAHDVLERSKEVPVVVDFWAPWCGPCRVLGPVIEREVEALAGRVELAKLNTDQAPALATQYGIQGIPAVKAFRNGEVVSEFVGARPAPFVKNWLAQLAPPPGVEALAKAEAAVAGGRHEEAESLLRPLVEDPDAKDRASLLLARVLFARGASGDEVRAALTRIDPRSESADAIPSIERMLTFADDARAYGDEAKARAAVAADPKDHEARWALGSALAARGDFAGALETFLELVTRNRKFKEDGARLAMLAIFEHLGPDHELSHDFRRRLQIVT